MSLLALANELLLEITRHLRAFEIEALAKTFNKRLYAICAPRLVHRIATKRNARQMKARFGYLDRGDLWVYWCGISISTTHYLKLDPEYGYYPPAGTGNMDFLDLTGDFSWLPAVSTGNNPDGGPGSKNKQLDVVLMQAERLGIILPDAFIHAMRDRSIDKLKYFVCDNGDTYEGDVLRLYKCPAFLDATAGGYLIQFASSIPPWSKSNICYLYVQGTNHCVFGSNRDMSLEVDQNDFDDRYLWEDIEAISDDEVVAAEKERLFVANFSPLSSVTMLDTDFEVFVARTFFEGLLDNVSDNGRPSSGITAKRADELREYIVKVYNRIKNPPVIADVFAKG